MVSDKNKKKSKVFEVQPAIAVMDNIHTDWSMQQSLQYVSVSTYKYVHAICNDK